MARPEHAGGHPLTEAHRILLHEKIIPHLLQLEKIFEERHGAFPSKISELVKASQMIDSLPNGLKKDMATMYIRMAVQKREYETIHHNTPGLEAYAARIHNFLEFCRHQEKIAFFTRLIHPHIKQRFPNKAGLTKAEIKETIDYVNAAWRTPAR